MYMNNQLSFIGHSHTLTPSYNQQRTAPYNTNSPRIIRRQGMCYYTI
jgi:hypothetical protein